MSRKPEHCGKHEQYESWCFYCVCAEESSLDDENDRLRERVAELEKELSALRTCTIDRESELSVLEKELDEARKDAKSMAAAANLMMHLLEHKDYPEAIAIMEKYK